jgi:hypothetical protein
MSRVQAAYFRAAAGDKPGMRLHAATDLDVLDRAAAEETRCREK